MKKNLLLTMVCAFTLCTGSLLAQDQATIASWDFDSFGTATPGTANYLYWGLDDLGYRICALNEYESKKDVTFAAVYDGTRDGDYIFVNCPLTLVTTTTFGGYCLNASSDNGIWDRNDALGRSTRYWLMDNISTVGLKDLVVTMYIAGVGTQGPTEFKFGYKIGDGDWVDGEFKTIRSNCAQGAPLTDSDLRTDNVPAACNNQAKVAFRWVVGENRLDGTPLVTGTAVRVDKIAVKGTSTGESSIINPKSEQLVYADGSRLVGGVDANVTVYSVAGTTVYAGTISKGGSIELPKGVYVVKAIADAKAETIKILIK